MKTVLHSVSYAGLWRGQHFLTLEEFLLKAHALGYDGVELTAKRPHLSPLDCDAQRIAGLQGILRDTGLECAALAAYTDFCAGLAEGLVPLAEMQQIYIRELCALAQKLGCRLIRVFTGYESKAVPYWTQWDACVRAVRACCDIAADYGVDIGIQNHHDIAVDAPSLRDFLDEVDRANCKAMLDPWFIAAMGQDAEQSIELVRDALVYSTFADYKRVQRFNYRPNLVNYTQDTPMLKAVRIGEGIIEAERFIQLLRRAGFDGYLAYEMCSQIQGGGSEQNLDSFARAFLDFVGPLIG